MTHGASGSEYKSFVQGLGWVTLVSACAFSMSCAYVSGFQESEYVPGLKEGEELEMVSHFLPIDYVVITPQWIVPAADSLLGVVALICALIALLLRNPPEAKVSTQSSPILLDSQKSTIRFNRIGWLAFFGLFAIAVFSLVLFAKDQKLRPFRVEVIKPILVGIMPVLICVMCMGTGHILGAVWVHFQRVGFRHFPIGNFLLSRACARRAVIDYAFRALERKNSLEHSWTLKLSE